MTKAQQKGQRKSKKEQEKNNRKKKINKSTARLRQLTRNHAVFQNDSQHFWSKVHDHDQTFRGKRRKQNHETLLKIQRPRKTSRSTGTLGCGGYHSSMR